MISKTTAVPSNPRGKGMSIWWIGCPKIFALASMETPFAGAPVRRGGGQPSAPRRELERLAGSSPERRHVPYRKGAYPPLERGGHAVSARYAGRTGECVREASAGAETAAAPEPSTRPAPPGWGFDEACI